MNLVGHLEADGDARVHVGDNLSNVHNYFAASGDECDVELRNDFLRHLNTTPYKERKNRNPKRVDGTCEWFTAHHLFRNWQRETSAPLWVSADPGCGKSVLARYLIDEVIPSDVTRKRRTCYFFFKDDFEDQKTAEGAIRCILHQLFVEEPALLSNDILGQYAFQKEQYLTSFSKLWSLLLEIAGKREYGEIICVLDALDECEGHTPLTEALTQLYHQNKGVPGLKFILTSRPYRKHQREFQSLVQSQPTIHLRGDGQDEVDKIALEISIAIKRRIDDLCRRFPIFLEERPFMEEELAKIENRTYLWVDLVFNRLENAVFHSKHELRSCIYDLPRTVDAAYEKILLKSADPAKAQKIFHIILAAVRPLLLAEMAAMLALQEDHARHQDLERDILTHESLSIEIREACGLFITIKDKKISFLHQTAREFLLQAPDQPSVPGWQHSIDTQISHLLMSRLCIQYLWFPELQKLRYNPETARPFVLLEYAAKYWTIHYRQARDADARLQSLAMQLCNSDFAITEFWVTMYLQTHRNLLSALVELDALLTSSLIVASYFGCDGLVSCVLQQDKHNGLNYKNAKIMRTALSLAIQRGHGHVVRLLLDRVPNWQVKLRDKLHTPITTIVNHKDAHGRTPLSRAAYEINMDIVRQLVERGARITARDRDKDTPLLGAVRRRNAEVVDFLLSCDAGSAVKSKQLKTRDREGKTPISVILFHAKWFRNAGIVLRLLLDHGADVNASDEDGTTALEHASLDGTLEMVKLLLDRGAYIEASGRFGETALMTASRHGYIKVVKLLLDRGADPNARGTLKETALILASRARKFNVTKLLLEYGADVNLREVKGKTALTFALRRENWGRDPPVDGESLRKSIVKLLTDRGAIE